MYITADQICVVLVVRLVSSRSPPFVLDHCIDTFVANSNNYGLLMIRLRIGKMQITDLHICPLEGHGSRQIQGSSLPGKVAALRILAFGPKSKTLSGNK